MRIALSSLVLAAWALLAGRGVTTWLTPGGRGREGSSFLDLLVGLGLTGLAVIAGMPLVVMVWIMALGTPLLLGLFIVLRRRPFQCADPVALALTALAFLPALIGIVFIPLMEWDARSLWFFHGKIIYYAGSLGPHSGILDWAVSGSHVEYPKLVPVLGALGAALSGHWNEYLPKLGLIPLWLGVVLGLAESRVLSRGAKLGGSLALIFLAPRLFYNGYVDAWLAAFGLIGFLYLVEHLRTRSLDSLRLGVAALLFLPLLKNEGMVLSIIGLVCFGAVWWRRYRREWAADRGPWVRAALHQGALVWAVVAAPTLLWAMLWRWWGIAGNDLKLGSLETVQRAWGRLWSAESGLIFQSFVVNTGLGWLILAAALAGLVVWLAARRRGHGDEKTWAPDWRGFWFLAAVALAYGLVLVGIYLSTPHDLAWHLRTSVDRVVLPVQYLLLGAGAVLVGRSVQRQRRSS